MTLTPSSRGRFQSEITINRIIKLASKNKSTGTKRLAKILRTVRETTLR